MFQGFLKAFSLDVFLDMTRLVVQVTPRQFAEKLVSSVIEKKFKYDFFNFHTQKDKHFDVR